MKTDKGSGPFFVYKITNTVNGKAYIGITSVSPEARFDAHIKRAKKFRDRQVFAAAICKYGAESFVLETLGIVDTWEDAQRAEIRLVDEIGTHISTGNGYNMTLGGDGSYGRSILGKGESNAVTNAERQRLSRQRQSLAYEIVKALAQRAGYMKDVLDTAGLDRYMADFPISGDEIDWYEAVDDLR